MLEEISFTCPCCWQEISAVVDLSVDEQEYVEDCEVCCRPLLLRIRSEATRLVSFEAVAVDQG